MLTSVFGEPALVGSWPRVFNLWNPCRGNGHVKNVPPRGVAHPVPNTAEDAMFRVNTATRPRWIVATSF